MSETSETAPDTPISIYNLGNAGISILEGIVVEKNEHIAELQKLLKAAYEVLAHDIENINCLKCQIYEQVKEPNPFLGTEVKENEMS